MKKLKLNKKTISQMERTEMQTVKGGVVGICILSCNNGTAKSKACCGSSRCTKPMPTW